MEVQFKRTGERRYAIMIIREGYPTIEMNPAPGYDPIMPHDLAHLIVEKEIGLRRGIFGQIAAGGNAGTFHPVVSAGENKRESARLRRKATRRGEKLLREGRDESAVSERAVYVCLNEWLSRSADPNRRKLGVQLSPQYKQLSDDGEILTDEILNRVCASLDRASEQWVSLEIGESFSETWPNQAFLLATDARRSGCAGEKQKDKIVI
ncbi:MAG TPA: hypothetical protein VJ810_01605 [Blastocatellia bacterium]|nr:hypothetical protein [Blastocatellia bacterium]